MVRLVFLFVAFLHAGVGAAQLGNADCDFSTYGVYTMDSFYFEAGAPSSGIGNLVIDTSFPGNIWQTGVVQKAGFPGAYSGTQALQTDTLLPYPPGNESAAVLYLDTLTVLFGSHASLIFWHYYDTDSLQDSCLLQITADTGKTWQAVPFSEHVENLNIDYSGSLPFSFNSDVWWSGRSDGWQRESICITFLPVKGMAISRNFGFRFLFVSDTVETSKPGWMIDNIRLRYPQVLSGINHRDQQAGLLYPNPSASGQFHIDYPSGRVTGSISIFNQLGQLVHTGSLTTLLDLSGLPRGLYYYKISFDHTRQLFSGPILYLSR